MLRFKITDYQRPLVQYKGAGMAQWLSICLPCRPPTNVARVRRQMWVEFVVGSRPCSERFFSGYSGFPLPSKSNISKFQLTLKSPEWDEPIKYVFIYVFNCILGIFFIYNIGIRIISKIYPGLWIIQTPPPV